MLTRWPLLDSIMSGRTAFIVYKIKYSSTGIFSHLFINLIGNIQICQWYALLRYT